MVSSIFHSVRYWWQVGITFFRYIPFRETGALGWVLGCIDTCLLPKNGTFEYRTLFLDMSMQAVAQKAGQSSLSRKVLAVRAIRIVLLRQASIKGQLSVRLLVFALHGYDETFEWLLQSFCSCIRQINSPTRASNLPMWLAYCLGPTRQSPSWTHGARILNPAYGWACWQSRCFHFMTWMSVVVALDRNWQARHLPFQ
jgi:hypothetical protein